MLTRIFHKALPILLAAFLPHVAVHAAETAPDASVAPPFKLSPNGTLIMTAARSKVWIPPASEVMLAPLSAHPGIKGATTVYLIVDGVSQGDGLDVGAAEPLLSVQGLPAGAKTDRSRRLARATIADTEGQIVEAMQCVLENRDPRVNPTFSPAWHDERLRVSIGQSQGIGDVHFFSESAYIGRVPVGTDVAAIDLRGTKSGAHTLWCVAETADGVVLPPVKSAITVLPRFTVAVDSPRDGYVIPVGSTDVSLEIKVTRAPDIDSALTKVSVGGVAVGESDRPSFDLKVPLKGVPTGPTLVEVFAIGKDGRQYAPEAVKVQVFNKDWDARVANTPEFKAVQESLPQIEMLEQDAVAWVERAKQDPGFARANRITATTPKTTAARLTFNLLESYRTAGQSRMYIASARKDLQEKGRIFLENGRAYVKIKMLPSARLCFQQALDAAGGAGDTGVAAQAELARLGPAP